MKNSIFRDITPCSPLKVNRRFGGTCRLHLHGRRINQERNKHEAGSEESKASLPPAIVSLNSFNFLVFVAET
jgi:hypothetical protein